jgi:hypothetical protein
MKRFGVAALIVVTVLLSIVSTNAQQNPDYPKVLRAIADDIASLHNKFPQLKDFSPESNIQLENLAIDYSYHTHRAQHRGGWTAGVPNPDPDGVWFYINFHSPDSTAQIDTQPVTSPERSCLGEKRITFLILEGPESKPFAGEIWSILKKRGVRPCRER